MIKRGQLEIKALIVLVISGVIIFAFPSIRQSYGSRDVYKKELAAKEIALIIDTLYAYPYDTTIYYEQDLTGLVVEISNNEVIVHDTKKLDLTYAKYQFFPSNTYEIKTKLENPKKIIFEKSRTDLIIKKDEAIK